MINVINNCHGYLPPGFFSNFLIVLDWIHNSIYEKEKINVDWTCNNKPNLWELFFSQPKTTIDGSDIDRNININHYRYMYKQLINKNIENIIPIYKNYNGIFWNNPLIFEDSGFGLVRDEYNKAYNTFTINDNIKQKVNEHTKMFKDKKVLGVTVRIPLHYTLDKPEGKPLSSVMSNEDFYDNLVEEISQEYHIGGYDKIFVCCDVQYFIDLMEKKFSGKVYYTKYDRVKDLNGDWNHKGLPLEKEYELVLIDTLIISHTSMIMGGSSNIFLSSLFINNKVDFKVFNLLKEYYGC